MTKPEPVVKDLQETYQNLKTEQIEYQKYKRYLQLEIQNLIDANEKLLSCLKDRQQTYVKLSSQEIEIDDLIENKTTEMQTKDNLKNAISEINKQSDKTRFISPIISQSENRLKSIKNNVKQAKGEPIIDIFLLSNKKKYIENENANLQNEVDKFNELLKEKVDNNEIPDFILSDFNLFVQKSEEMRNKNQPKSTSQEKNTTTIPIIKPTIQNSTKSFFQVSSKNKLSNFSSMKPLKLDALSQNNDFFYTDNGGLRNHIYQKNNSNQSLTKTKSQSYFLSSTNFLVDIDQELEQQQRKTSLKKFKKKLLSKSKKTKNNHRTMSPQTLFELLDIDLNSTSGFSEFYDSDYHNDRHRKQKDEEQKIDDLCNIDFSTEKEEDISTKHTEEPENLVQKNQEEINDDHKKNSSDEEHKKKMHKKEKDEDDSNSIPLGLITHSNVEPYHSNPEELIEYEEEEEEEEYYEEEDFAVLVQRKTQTLSSIRNKKAENIIHELAEIEKCQRLMEKISQTQIEMYNIDSDLLELTKRKDIKEMRIDTIRKRLKMVRAMTTIDVPPPEKTKYADSSAEIKPEIDIDTIKDQLDRNVSKASNHFLFIQSKRDLEQSLMKLNVKINLINQENEKKDHIYEKLMSRLHIIDPYAYNIEAKIEQPDECVDPEIIVKRNQKRKLKKKLERRIEQLQKECHSIEVKMNDIRFFIKKNKKELYQNAKSPHLMVDKLCHQLKSDRIVLQGVAKRTAFVYVESNFLTDKLNEMDARYCNEALAAFKGQIDLIEQQMRQTKTRYGQLVSKKGKRAIVLTNQAELTMFQQKINERINEIDVYKMRMNGIVSKVENQMRTLKHLNVNLPKPPEFWDTLASTVKKKANIKNPKPVEI